jgi:signal transduction histidine kinase
MEDTTGVLWFSLASSGGFSLQDGKLNQLQTFEGKRIHWFWEDPDGMIWVGHESGLYQRRDGRFQRVDDRRMDRLKSPRFLCHFAAADGTLWMGTSNGIVRYRSGRFDAFAPEDGLRADNIERLVADHQGSLWFGGRDGLFRSRISELNDFAAGHLESVASYRVDGFERFPPINAFSQGCLLRNDALYIVGEQGLIRLPIGPFQREAMPPPVRIEQAIVDEVPASFERPFEFLSGQRRLSIQYAVPAFVNPHHTQVKYRLDQHDDRWIDSGSSRTAHYTNLPPGDYRFRVAARSGNQPWVEADPAMSFTVLPRWWERTWLRVATVLMTVVAGLGYIQYRIRRLRRSNAALRREINERKRAEEQSRNHLAQLARVSRAASMGELTTSIAHEVKQPLFAIVSNAQTARRLLDRDEPDIDEVRDALHDIADDGNRASNIIDRVRSLVKKERHPTHDLDLNEVARDASNFAELEMRNRGFVIETEFATDLPLVRANPIELQQVILNLLINGAQSMIDTAPEARLLTMRTSATGDSVELAVEDRGVGLHEGTLEKLFEPFFTTKPQGTGMGLAINRTIIEAHDGRIWATQNPDRGLTFHFSLPAGQKSRPHDNISGNSREASL